MMLFKTKRTSITKKITFVFLCIPFFICSQLSHADTAEQCKTLSCVRSHIDTIDAQVVKLIAKRLSYVQKAGELKAGVTPLHDSVRENQILKNVESQMEALNYPPDIAQAIFKTILKQSNQYEENYVKILRVGTTGDYPPLTYYDAKTGKFSGIDIDKALDLGKYLGRKIQFVLTSWSTLSADLMENKFDIAIGGISDSPERRRKFLLTRPVLTDGKIPLVRCDEIERYATLDKINQSQVRVIENSGGTNEQFAEKFLPEAELIIVKKNAAAFDYLLENRADVMITDRIEALYKQKTMPGLCAVHPERLLATFHKVYLLSKSQIQLLEPINRWIACGGAGIMCPYPEVNPS